MVQTPLSCRYTIKMETILAAHRCLLLTAPVIPCIASMSNLAQNKLQPDHLTIGVKAAMRTPRV